MVDICGPAITHSFTPYPHTLASPLPSCTLVWDPRRAEEKGPGDVCFEAIESLPSGIKEAGLVKLAELDYNVAIFQSSAARTLKPVDGSNWGPDRRARYRDEIFRSRKDLRAVCRAMRVSMRTCLAYYLGSFKSSDDYRLLKTVCNEEYKMRLEANEYEFDACAICGDGGSLLICDGCEGEYHMECCRPALRHVPEGQWLCDECVDRRFLAARQYLIQRSRLFEKCPDRKRRRLDGVVAGVEGSPEEEEEEEASDPGGLEKVVFRPTDSVLAAVRNFAKELNQALSTGLAVPVAAAVGSIKAAPELGGSAPDPAKEQTKVKQEPESKEQTKVKQEPESSDAPDGGSAPEPPAQDPANHKTTTSPPGAAVTE